MRRYALFVALLAVSLLTSAQVVRPQPAVGSGDAVLWLPLAYSLPQVGPTPIIMPATVRVAAWCSQFDAPGDDRDNLAEEYVCLQNYGDVAADLTAWRVRDLVGTTYTFSAFTLSAKATVRLRTGPGSDTATDVYWGRGTAVWNNDGDTVFLYDGAGMLMDRYTY